MDSSPTPVETKPARFYPGVAQACGLLGLFILISIPFSLPMVLAKRVGWYRILPLFNLLMQVGATAIVLRIGRSWGGRRWRDIFPNRRVELRVWPAVFVAALGLLLLINGCDNLLERVLPAPEWFHQTIRDMGALPVVFGAAFTEEPLFRGLILTGFMARYGPRRGILWSALLFAAFHFNPWQVITGVVIGIFLAWLVWRSGSLWPAVFAHLINNGVATGAEAWKVPFLSDNQLQPWWMWLAGLTLAGLGIAACHRWLAPGLEWPAEQPQEVPCPSSASPTAVA